MQKYFSSLSARNKLKRTSAGSTSVKQPPQLSLHRVSKPNPISSQLGEYPHNCRGQLCSLELGLQSCYYLETPLKSKKVFALTLGKVYNSTQIANTRTVNLTSSVPTELMVSGEDYLEEDLFLSLYLPISQATLAAET